MSCNNFSVFGASANSFSIELEVLTKLGFLEINKLWGKAMKKSQVCVIVFPRHFVYLVSLGRCLCVRPAPRGPRAHRAAGVTGCRTRTRDEGRGTARRISLTNYTDSSGNTTSVRPVGRFKTPASPWSPLGSRSWGGNFNRSATFNNI